MEAREPQPQDIFAEFERLLHELRTHVDALRDDAVDIEQLQSRLSELDDLAGRAAAALEQAKQ
jgi:exonuclease VII small subunit